MAHEVAAALNFAAVHRNALRQVLPRRWTAPLVGSDMQIRARAQWEKAHSQRSVVSARDRTNDDQPWATRAFASAVILFSLASILRDRVPLVGPLWSKAMWLPKCIYKKTRKEPVGSDAATFLGALSRNGAGATHLASICVCDVCACLLWDAALGALVWGALAEKGAPELFQAICVGALLAASRALLGACWESSLAEGALRASQAGEEAAAVADSDPHPRIDPSAVVLAPLARCFLAAVSYALLPCPASMEGLKPGPGLVPLLIAGAVAAGALAGNSEDTSSVRRQPEASLRGVADRIAASAQAIALSGGEAVERTRMFRFFSAATKADREAVGHARRTAALTVVRTTSYWLPMLAMLPAAVGTPRAAVVGLVLAQSGFLGRALRAMGGLAHSLARSGGFAWMRAACSTAGTCFPAGLGLGRCAQPVVAWWKQRGPRWWKCQPPKAPNS